MAHEKCLICKNREADKTNSHIIPSFLVAMFTSADDSGKRDTEVMFTISNKKQTTVYTGRSIPGSSRDSLFDESKMKQERIDGELKNNTASRDYVFCNTCEKRMGNYLESPYGSHVREGRKVDVDSAYFFWLSIIWRMSVVGEFGYKLPDNIENALGKSLNDYLNAKAENKDISAIVKESQFRYKLLHCDNYSKKKGGFQNANYNGETVDLMVGDFLLRVSFEKAKDFPNPPYYGAEEYFDDAAVNEGEGDENVKEISTDDYAKIVQSFISDVSGLKLRQIGRLLDAIWSMFVGSRPMPTEMKKAFVENYLSDDIKIGDRHTNHNFALAFQKVLFDNGIIKQ